jgi:EmrB/QacA subfamily drug resistance transporter
VRENPESRIQNPEGQNGAGGILRAQPDATAPKPQPRTRPTSGFWILDSGFLSLAALVAAVFLGAVDQTAIVTTLPAIVTDLQIPFGNIDQAAWIVSGYLLGYTVALPLMGRFADVYGHRTSLAIALAVFALGSLGCALSGSLAVLVAARLVQAAGGGALVPVAVAVVSEGAGEEVWVTKVGAIIAVAETGPVLGPLYGAGIVAWLSWRWIFWINIPLALVILAAATFALRDRPRPEGRLDLIGAGLASAALGFLILGCAHEEVGVAGADLRWALLVLAVVAFVGFVAWERRTPDPLLDLSFFGQPSFAAALAAGFVLGGALIVALADVPLFAATVLGASPAEGGLLLMRLTAPIPIGAILGALLVRTVGLRLPTALGFLGGSLGLAAMASWGTAPSAALLWASLGVAGLGFGLLLVPLILAVMNVSGPERHASASALFNVTRMTGMTVGLSILTTWGLQRFDDLAGKIPLPLPQPGETAAQAQARLDAFNRALVQAGAETYHEIFLAAAAISLLGLACALLLRVPGSANRTWQVGSPGLESTSQDVA